MKRLTLMRHAKSSWGDVSLSDFDRPLNDRGKRDAPAVGKRLAARGVRPGLIVTSPAKRARKTAKIIAAALGFPKEEILRDQSIYEAGTGTLLELVRTLDDGVDEVILVGHNPGFTDLARALTGAGIDNVPTCGAVAMEFVETTWKKVGRGGGRLLFFEFPKLGEKAGDGGG